jgi:hypothetical protein
MIPAAILAWVTFCMIFLVADVVLESALWARVKRWRQIRHVMGGDAVLESVLQDRGYTTGVSAALDVEGRVRRAARIVSSVPQEIAIEILERTEIARDQIQRERKAARL